MLANKIAIFTLLTYFSINAMDQSGHLLQHIATIRKKSAPATTIQPPMQLPDMGANLDLNDKEDLNCWYYNALCSLLLESLNLDDQVQDDPAHPHIESKH